MQLNVILQGDGTGQPDAFGNGQAPAAEFGQLGDAFPESFGIEGHTVAHASTIGEAHFVLGNHDRLYSLHWRRQGLVIRLIIVGPGTKGE